MEAGIHWTNKSVLRLAGEENPITAIEKKARELVLRACDAGWKGPPFDPLRLADLLQIRVEANADIADARTVTSESKLLIQFNPTQPRERVRFSIAHEIGHALFPDVADKARHRGSEDAGGDNWQLEMLCNIAASEFVMPIGSLTSQGRTLSIEELMIKRREYDVSAEAFLIRSVRIADDPVLMFCASPVIKDDALSTYRIDYVISSKTAPNYLLTGKTIPQNSVVYSCTAIGYSDKKVEKFHSSDAHLVECVGIPGYPGSRYPRVAGMVRFTLRQMKEDEIKIVHGDVFSPRGTDARIICQLVNDQARIWGGGVAKAAAKRFPDAQSAFANWVTSMPRADRLGKVHFADVENSITIASLVAQYGYGPSDSPRIRYAALERALTKVAEYASKHSASVHMPRIGGGQSGGSWEIVEEIIRATLVARGISVTLYDLPPRRISSANELLIEKIG